MTTFSPRLSVPLPSDKYFINYKHGGYNTAIAIDSNGSVIPNCVGYAQGRFREICGDKNVWSVIGVNLAGNAETFFPRAKAAGLLVGQEPKLGAIVVWEGVGSAAGHVAVVEKINTDAKGNIVSIVTSNSAYKGTRFYTQTLTKESGYLYKKDGSRPLLGFIYPNMNFENNQIKPTQSNKNPFSIKDIVRLKPGAKWNNGSSIASWVFNKNLTVKGVNGDLLILSTEGFNGGTTGSIHYNNVYKTEYIQIEKKTSLSKNDAVHFNGQVHYTSSYNTAQGKKALPCTAKVTAINTSSASNVVRHYHLVGPNVNGWVDDKDILELQ